MEFPKHISLIEVQNLKSLADLAYLLVENLLTFSHTEFRSIF